MREDIVKRRDEIEQWVKENKSKAWMARQLGCNPKTVTTTLERWGIQYSGNQSGRGLSKNRPKMNLEEYLAESTDIQSNKVRINL